MRDDEQTNRRIVDDAFAAAAAPPPGYEQRVLRALRARRSGGAGIEQEPRRGRTLRRGAIGFGALGGAVAAAFLALQLAPAGLGQVAFRHQPVAPGHQTEPTSLSAHDILLAAARQADAGTSTTGQYWHVSIQQGNTFEVGQGSGAYLVEMRGRDENWLAQSPSGTSYYIGQYLGTGPLTPEDEAAWRRAGSPDHWEIRVPTAAGGIHKGKLVDAKPSPAHGNQLNVGSEIMDLGGKNESMASLQQLPSDPAALKALLVSRFRSGHEVGGDMPTEQNAWLFQVASSLLLQPVKPAVRAAAYRVLADLPRVRALGQTRDPLGRSGIGIAISESMPSLGTMDRQLIIDPSTGLLLTDQEIVVKPGELDASAKPGTRWGYRAAKEAGWTNDTPSSIPPPPAGQRGVRVGDATAPRS